MKTILTNEKGTRKLEITDGENDFGSLNLMITSLDNDAISQQIEIPLRELLPALIGFDAKYSRLEEDTNFTKTHSCIGAALGTVKYPLP